MIDDDGSSPEYDPDDAGETEPTYGIRQDVVRDRRSDRPRIGGGRSKLRLTRSGSGI